MKNISRRVFIKGMAVAAVATAASTVLTGCKLPVGPQEPVVETPSNQVVTLTDTGVDKSLTITAKSFAYVEENNLGIVGLHLDNQLPVNATFGTVADGSKYMVEVTYKTTDKDGNVSTTKASSNNTDSYKSNILGNTKLDMESKSTDDGYLYINLPAAKEWEKVEVTVTLVLNYAYSSSNYTKKTVAYGSFTFNK